MKNNSINQLLTLIFLLSISFHAFSQLALNGGWNGTLITASGQIYPVEIKVKTKKKIITGTMTTFGPGDFNVATKLTGENNSSQTRFNESEIISISDSVYMKDMCYVNFENVKESKVAGKKVISGNYYGIYTNGLKCDSGTYILTSMFIPKVVKKKIIQSYQSVVDSLKLTPMTINNNDTLAANEVTMISNNDGVIDISLVDSGIIDGDSLLLTINNHSSIISLTGTPHQIKKSIGKNKKLSIAFKALNEGEVRPNTSAIKILNGNNERELYLKLGVNESAQVIFIRK